MIPFPVTEEKRKWLQEKMETLQLHEKDIEEKFVRSSGRGGQKVNKTSTCVYLKHLPTGIEVKCMKERNQSLNRFLARRELVRQMEIRSGESAAEKAGIIKIRSRKSKRRKRSRLKYQGKNGTSQVEEKGLKNTVAEMTDETGKPLFANTGVHSG